MLMAKTLVADCMRSNLKQTQENYQKYTLKTNLL